MKCLVDLDGVLANFVQGAMRVHNTWFSFDDVRWGIEEQFGMDPKKFWAKCDEAFWAELEPTEEKVALLALVESYFDPAEIYICSSPCATMGSATGKIRWVEKHIPNYRRQLILTGRKEHFANSGRLLIDDSDSNCEKWRAAGGDALLVPRPWNDNRGENTMDYIRGWF